MNWAALAELIGPASNDPDEALCERREEAVHQVLDAAGIPRGGLSVSGRVYFLIHGREPPGPGRPVPGEPPVVAENRKRANDAHEAWVAPIRKRWGARDDAEELYLRRASEMSAHQMLDDAGVPAGGLSLNGRIATALNLRYASAGPASGEAPPKAGKAKASEAQALLRRLPRAPWPVVVGAQEARHSGEERARPQISSPDSFTRSLHQIPSPSP